MYQFDYQCPNSLAAAKASLAAAEDGRFLAGGMTLLPTLKVRLAQPDVLVDLAAIDELCGIRQEDHRLVVGAMSKHDEVARSATVADALPVLATVAGGIGDPQVRNRGTIGGSIANADPAADYPAAVLGLAATVHTDQRSITGDEFFTGMFETALEPGEIITKLEFPVGVQAAYSKFPNPASRYAIVGVLVARLDAGVRVAVTGAGPNAFRVAAMEEALNNRFSAEVLDGISIAAADFNTDIHASAEYRAHLVTVMAKRAVEAASG
jgi:carbon-monoxide dehydrogenase medium subunit